MKSGPRQAPLGTVRPRQAPPGLVVWAKFVCVARWGQLANFACVPRWGQLANFVCKAHRSVFIFSVSNGQFLSSSPQRIINIDA